MGYEQVETRWGLHSIITFSGKPFCVMQEWGLWRYNTRKITGGRALESMPTGEVELIPLRELVPEDSKDVLMEEVDGR